MKKNIVIFGGSFDPVHKGHINIVNSILNTIELEQLIIVPSKMGPWKQRTLTDGYKRLEMLKLAFPNNPKITISDFEIKNSSISYTYKLIDHFKEKYPEYQLNFVYRWRSSS